MPIAYDAIVEILKNNFCCFKITTHDYPNDPRHHDGVQFTLYLSEEWENKIEELTSLLNEINEVLLQNNIQVGCIPKSDLLLSNGKYFSIRKQHSKNGKLI